MAIQKMHLCISPRSACKKWSHWAKTEKIKVNIYLFYISDYCSLDWTFIYLFRLFIFSHWKCVCLFDSCYNSAIIVYYQPLFNSFINSFLLVTYLFFIYTFISVNHVYLFIYRYLFFFFKLSTPLPLQLIILKPTDRLCMILAVCLVRPCTAALNRFFEKTEPHLTVLTQIGCVPALKTSAQYLTITSRGALVSYVTVVHTAHVLRCLM